ESGRRDAGQTLQRGKIVARMVARAAMANLVVSDQDAERLAAGHPELLAVDLGEELALIELDGAFEILADFRPGQVEDAYLDILAAFGLGHEILNTPPGGLHFLHARVVQNLIHLLG